MVNDSCFLLIKLDATLTAQLSERVTYTDPRDAWLSPYGRALGQATSLVLASPRPPLPVTPRAPQRHQAGLSPSWTAGQHMVKGVRSNPELLNKKHRPSPTTNTQGPGLCTNTLRSRVPSRQT